MISNERLKQLQKWAHEFNNRGYSGTLSPENYIMVSVFEIDKITSELLTARQTIERLIEAGDSLYAHCPPRGTDGRTTKKDLALDEWVALMKELEGKG